MTQDIKDVLKLALEALRQIDEAMPFPVAKLAQKVLREALAEQPEQEPVAWFSTLPDGRLSIKIVGKPTEGNWEPLYTTPPQRTWVGLTDEEKDAARWRFLVDNSFDKEGVTQFHVWEHSWEPHSQTGEPTEWKQRVRGPALDRFIDRAIEAKLKQKNGYAEEKNT